MSIFNDYTALYFFSAAFQGDIALLAFSGVFVTYRLQLISQEKDATAGRIREHVTSIFERGHRPIPDLIASSFLDPSYLMQAVELTSAKKESFEAAALNDMKQDSKLAEMIWLWTRGASIQTGIRERFQLPLILAALSVILALVALPASSLIHSLGDCYEAAAYAAYLVLNVWAIASNIKLTRFLLAVGEAKFRISGPHDVKFEQVQTADRKQESHA